MRTSLSWLLTLLWTQLALAQGGMDAVDGVVGEVACGDSITGTIDPTVDEPLGDGRFVDRYRLFVEVELRSTIVRAASDEFDPFLRVASLGNDSRRIEDDNSGGGIDARLEFSGFPVGDHEVQVSNAVATEQGAYVLTVTCPRDEDFSLPFRLPETSPESEGVIFPWSGIYVRADGPGEGLALDVQRGKLFGALYRYDDDGAPRFLTLQGAADEQNRRRFEGSVFRTTAGERSEAVGTFTVDLTTIDAVEPPVPFNAAAEVRISGAAIVDSDARWVRFNYTERNRTGSLEIYEEATLKLDVITDEPEERAIAERLGVIRFPVVLPTGGFRSASVELLDGVVVGSAFLSGNPFTILMSTPEDPGDRLQISLMPTLEGFAGVARVYVDDQPGPERDATGIVISWVRR